VEEIEHSHSINIDLVYAEAKYLLGQGEKYYFENTVEIEKNNEQFRVINPMETLLLEKYSPMPLPEDPDEPKVKDIISSCETLNATNVYTKLFNKQPNSGSASLMGKILTHCNFKSSKTNGIKSYTLYKKGI
jgi:hypothetical protein